MGCCFQLRMKIVYAGYSEPLTTQSAGVILTPDKSPDFGDPRQVRRIETSDGATTDNAYSLQRYTRLSTRTSFCAWPISFATMARNRLSALLNESAITMPLANSASCKAAEMV